MAVQYIASKPVGPWKKGEIIGDLPTGQIKQLLADGVIKEAPAAKTITKKEALK